MSQGGRHDPALELLRDLAAPAQLSSPAKRRIAERLGEQPARARSRPAWIAVPSVVALALLVWRVSTRAPAATAQHDVAQAFVVPPCGVARVAAGEHFAAALVGPADAQVNGGSRQRVALHAGRFIVRTKADRVEVETPDARVEVAPASFAEIEVRALHPTRVAVYTGNARVDVATGRATVLVDAGAAWSAGELRRTAVTDSAAAAQILAPTSGAAQLCPAPAESPVVAPLVGATKPPAPAVGQSVRVRPPASHRASSPATPLAEPVATPSPTPSPPPSIAETTTGDAQRLAAAIHRLRQDHDAKGALALLATVSNDSAFADELALVRLEALLALGDRSAALATLDALPLPDGPRGAELLVLRAELRAETRRWREAIDDYSRDRSAATSPIAERALFGLARCRLEVGEVDAARAGLQAYLKRFPAGRFATDARRILSTRE